MDLKGRLDIITITVIAAFSITISIVVVFVTIFVVITAIVVMDS